MLVLRKKEGERLLLETESGDVLIAFMDIGRGYLRVGIAAPDSVNIFRVETLPPGRQTELDDYGKRLTREREAKGRAE